MEGIARLLHFRGMYFYTGFRVFCGFVVVELWHVLAKADRPSGG